MAEIKAKKVIFKNRDGEYLLPMTEEKTGLVLFDTILKDHILTYEESKGLALQGTYVYKNAVAGSRYGYPDFYNKCLEEYLNSSNTKQWLKSNVTYTGAVTDNQGVLSGFSTANYATLPSVFRPLANPWEMVIKMTTGSDVTTGQIYTSFQNGTTEATRFGTRLLILNNKFDFSVSYNGSAWDINNSGIGIHNVQPNTTYYVKLEYTGSAYKLSYSFDGKDFTEDSSVESSTPIYGSNAYHYLGVWHNKSAIVEPFLGSIDLKESYININGERWWTGTKTAIRNPNGHIFYDISIKELIDDMFESTGMAWMYGIDQENERIFLPRNVWFEQMSIDDVGKAVEAGLPSIAHTHTFKLPEDNGSGGSLDKGMYNGPGNVWQSWKTATNSAVDAIYGKSDTVQPNAVKKLLYICVGNTEAHRVITDVVDVTTTENDTIPLLTGMYFDFTPNNISWVKAGEQRKSGGVYTFCYNELVNELTNPKYDIKVVEIKNMIAGIDYSEYWKVNQDDMTFATPAIAGLFPNNRILVAKKEPTEDDATWYNLYSDGWCEQGGICNSQAYDVAKQQVTFSIPYKDTSYTASTSAGPTTQGSWQIATRIAIKTTTGLDIRGGSNATSGYTGACAWQTSGYAEIPTVSDYTENVNLYFKVANAVQNLELMDVARIEATKANKTDVDGQWVWKGKTLSEALAIGVYTLDLSDYLPNDGYIYEVWGQCYLSRGGDSGTNTNVYIRDGFGERGVISQTMADGTNFQQGTCQFLLTVDTQRTIQVEIANLAAAACGIYVYKYRRLGTNQ